MSNDVFIQDIILTKYYHICTNIFTLAVMLNISQYNIIVTVNNFKKPAVY